MGFLPEGVDWGSRIPAYAGLVLSILALWKGRIRVTVYLGCEERDDVISVSNLSPYAIELTSLGAVEADGSVTDWSDGPDAWPGLPCRMEARSETSFLLHSELAPYSAYNRKVRGRCGCFVRIAGGRLFSNPGLLGRMWWKILSWFERKIAKG